MENYIKISRKVFLFIYRSVVKCFITIPMRWYSNLQWHIIKGQFKDIGSNVQIAFPFCGYGLENIREIAKRYGGNMEVEYTEKEFVLFLYLRLE